MKSFSSVLGSVESTLTFRDTPAPVPVDKITAFEPGPKLAQFCVIADEEFNIGVAWYCVETSSGCVYRVSPKFGEEPEFVNSSVETFLASLTAAAQWSLTNDEIALNRNPSCIDDLERALAGIDSVAMTWPKNQWPTIIQHLRKSVDPDDDESVYFFRTT